MSSCWARPCPCACSGVTSAARCDSDAAYSAVSCVLWPAPAAFTSALTVSRPLLPATTGAGATGFCARPFGTTRPTCWDRALRGGAALGGPAPTGPDFAGFGAAACEGRLSNAAVGAI